MKKIVVGLFMSATLLLPGCFGSARKIEAKANTKVSVGNQVFIKLESSDNSDYKWQLINANNKKVLVHTNTDSEIEKKSGKHIEKRYFEAVGTGTDTLTFRLVHLTGPDKNQVKDIISTKSYIIEVI